MKTQFDPVKDRAEVVQLLRAGCAHMRKAFDIEDINLDDLIATAMDDPKALAGDIKAFRGINFDDLLTAYRQFCKNETVENSPVDLGEVIEFYNKAAADLPDHNRLKGLRLPGMSTVLDGKGERFAEVFEPGNRRIWVPLGDIPEFVQKAFVAAEDKRFYEHKGIDERGLIRAFIGNMAEPGRPQGGSTITQQVAKNLLVGDDVTYERKIREMIVASRLESTLTKPEILELYLNSIYLGRGSWGVEMAARSWFGKSVKDLSLAPKARCSPACPRARAITIPDRHPERAQERLAYVLGRMQEDGVITAEAMKRSLAAPVALASGDRMRRFRVPFRRSDRPRGQDRRRRGLTTASYAVHSTIQPDLQRAAETALQDGLARYEINTGRFRFEGPEANLAEAIKKIEAERQKSDPAASASPPVQTASTNPRRRLPSTRSSPRGSRRSKPRGCRSTTCTGRARLF